MSTTEDPILREVNGRVEVEWPDPPRRSYEVAHEIVQQMVDRENERRDLRDALKALLDADETFRWDGPPIEEPKYLTILENAHDALAAAVGQVVTPATPDRKET